jgi:hypothetical protein
MCDGRGHIDRRTEASIEGLSLVKNPRSSGSTPNSRGNQSATSYRLTCRAPEFAQMMAH